MNVATSRGVRVEVGVRELKNNLSRYLDRVQSGDEVIVTEHGHPVARLTTVDEATSKLAKLVAAGLVRAPTKPARRRPVRRVAARDTVSDLVADQRR